MRMLTELPLKATDAMIHFGEKAPLTELRFRLAKMAHDMYTVHIYDRNGKLISLMNLVDHCRGYHTIYTVVLEGGVIVDVAIYERFHRWTISVAG